MLARSKAQHLAAVAGVAMLVVACGGPAPRDRFEPVGDGVRDNLTGLTWERTVSSTPISWNDADARCRSMPGGGRLPSATELAPALAWATLGTFALNEPLPSGYYWSSLKNTEDPADYAIWCANANGYECDTDRNALLSGSAPTTDGCCQCDRGSKTNGGFACPKLTEPSLGTVPMLAWCVRGG